MFILAIMEGVSSVFGVAIVTSIAEDLGIIGIESLVCVYSGCHGNQQVIRE